MERKRRGWSIRCREREEDGVWCREREEDGEKD